MVTGSLRGAAKAATWQSVFSLLCSCNLLQYQRSSTAPKAPLCKGGWLDFAETRGLFRRIGPSKVESDYELSDFWTWRSRILRCISNCTASIPPSCRRKVRELRFRLWGEKLRSLPCSSSPHQTRYAGLWRGPLISTPPFTQGRLWFPATPLVR